MTVLALVLAFQTTQYGYMPGYATGSLPTCDAEHLDRVVVDSTEGVHKRCNGTSWVPMASSSGGLDAGLIVLSLTTCPAGYVEEASLVAKFPLGTNTAAGDVGGTGGSDTITSILNHTHPVTDSGHNHTQNSHTHVVTSQTATTGSATSYEHGTLDTSSAEAEATEVTGATTATNQSNTTGVTTSNPAGGVASIDNRPAFVKVIFCRKT